MAELTDFFRHGTLVAHHRPWPRVQLDGVAWQHLADRLPGEDWELLALWGEAAAVHVLLRDPGLGTLAIFSRACPDGGFASLAAARPAAIRMERAVHDLCGLIPQGLEDSRHWLDHGRWVQSQPLAKTPVPRALDAPAARATDYPFLSVVGEGLHQIPVGPVHAGIIEPGHFRFHANGETVVRLEERLGYVHKGVEKLMQGRKLSEAAKLAGRISGDSTVAYAIAFSRAVEAALDLRIPQRADFLRGVMAELERIANHLGDFGAICNDASFAFLQAEATVLREDVLRLSAKLFGHRLMMDRVRPGGVGVDLTGAGGDELRALAAEISRRLDDLVRVYDTKPSLLDRTIGTGAVGAHLVQRFAAGGFVGRASGRGFDARVSPGYHPYDVLEFEVPVLPEGDVHARVWIRIREIRQSLHLIAQLVQRMPGGPAAITLPEAGGEGAALVEGFRGEIFASVRLASDGSVERCHLRDPSWLQWPLLEAAIEGNIVADFPLCNKSFNCSYSGHDL
jgi:Ni,Fe-hydrogenase III large subunit